jgi:hypothetical protein
MLGGLFATILEKPNAVKGFGRPDDLENPSEMANLEPFFSKNSSN